MKLGKKNLVEKEIKKQEKLLDRALSAVFKKHFSSLELYENHTLLMTICEKMEEKILENPKLNFTQAAEKTVQEYKESIQNEINYMFTSLSKKDLEKILGKNLIRKLER